MTHDFKLGNGLKQGDGLAPNLFTIAISNKIIVKFRISTINRTCRWHKHHRKNKMSYSEVHKELKERAKEKSVVQNRNTRR
jgi:hypothetical protein